MAAKLKPDGQQINHSDSTTFCPGLPHVQEPANPSFRVGNKQDDRTTDDENDREIQS